MYPKYSTHLSIDQAYVGVYVIMSGPRPRKIFWSFTREEFQLFITLSSINPILKPFFKTSPPSFF